MTDTGVTPLLPSAAKTWSGICPRRRATPVIPNECEEPRNRSCEHTFFHARAYTV